MIERDEIIQLTNKAYRLTLLFPKKEPLRHMVREKVDEILEDLTRVIHSGKKNKETLLEAKMNLEILNSFFDIAKWQNWVSYFDVLEIQERYDKIRYKVNEELTTEEPEKKFSAMASDLEKQEMPDLDSRKEKILYFLREKGRAQVWELSQVFPEVSKRTLRRDFVQLLKQDLIERIGEKNDTFYRLKA